MQVHLDIKEVIMLEVAESIEMKVDEYCHDFRPAHSTFPIAVLTPVRLTNGHAGNLFIIFLAKIIDNTENFSNFGFFVNFGGKKIAYLWLKYLIVSTLISIIKVADVRIF